MAPSPSFLLLRRGRTSEGTEKFPSKREFAGCSLRMVRRAVPASTAGYSGFFPERPEANRFILALLRGHKGHLEEGRGNLGTPVAPGATPCSREHSGLFRVFLRRRGNTHLAQDVLSAERCLPREGVPTRAPYAALTFGAPRTWVLSPGFSSRGLPGAPAASEEPGEPEPEIRAQGP